jgi:hypothetical protein
MVLSSYRLSGFLPTAPKKVDYEQREVFLERVSELEKRGYNYLKRYHTSHIDCPVRIKMPSGRILDIKEINLDFKPRLEFGNKRQIESLAALEYHGLIKELGARFVLEHDYSSFDSREDEKRCKRKYSLNKSR